MSLPPATGKPHILLVDDDASLREFITLLLAPDYDVEAVGDGVAALSAARERLPNLVLMDVLMPGVGGLSVLQALRADPGTASVPVILITGRLDEEARAEGLAAGADDFLVKPFTARELLAHVREHLGLARLRSEAVRREQRHASEANARERLLRQALEAARMAVWRWDMQTDQLTLSENAPAVLGVPSGAGTMGLLNTRIHADDQASQRLRVAEAIARRGSYISEYRFRRPDDGREIWLEDRGSVEVDGDDRPIALSGVIMDITKRKELEHAYQRRMAELADADRRKDDFLAMLAHELRNPLAPVRNAVHVMKLIGINAPIFVQARDMIERQVSHMAHLIDDLLDVSRISRGKVLLRKVPVDLLALVQAAAEDHRLLLQGAGLTFELALSPAPIWVHGDPTRLAQIIGNLLQNAGKFTDRGGRVSLRLEKRDDQGAACISVEDTGIGMEPDIVGRLFEPFSQADRSLDRSRGGLGLGLALVKGLVELHGGRAQASSPGLGKGSSFTIVLPVIVTPSAPAGLAAPSPQSNGGLRILIIEDNRDAAESLRLLLDLSGHAIRVAHTGERGLEIARAFGPDVILCDIGLPGGLDGFAIARAVRADDELASAALIALSGYGQEDDQRRAREAGFDSHLTKPVDPAVLNRLLENLPRAGLKADGTGAVS